MPPNVFQGLKISLLETKSDVLKSFGGLQRAVQGQMWQTEHLPQMPPCFAADAHEAGTASGTSLDLDFPSTSGSD